jgi:hypothetical protein
MKPSPQANMLITVKTVFAIDLLKKNKQFRGFFSPASFLPTPATRNNAAPLSKRNYLAVPAKSG